MDFSKCKNKIVVDFGCNLGQTCTKTYFAGAKRAIGLDSQKDTIKMAKEISRVLETKIEFYTIDFNDKNFRNKIVDILNNKKIDISFFLSVYRTKELKDRNGLFNFIIEQTNEIIFFEGHAAPGIDTDEYYSTTFKNFPICFNFLGYTEEISRPFYEICPK